MICRTFCTDTASVSCHGSRCCLAQPSLLRCNADSGKIPLTHSIVLCCFSSYAQLTNECSLFTMAVISLHQLGESYQIRAFVASNRNFHCTLLPIRFSSRALLEA